MSVEGRDRLRGLVDAHPGALPPKTLLGELARTYGASATSVEPQRDWTGALQATPNQITAPKKGRGVPLTSRQATADEVGEVLMHPKSNVIFIGEESSKYPPGSIGRELLDAAGES